MEAYTALPSDAPPSAVAVFAIVRDQGPTLTTTLHTDTPLSTGTVSNATRYLRDHGLVTVEVDLTDYRHGNRRRYIWIPAEHDPPDGTSASFG